MGSIDSKSQAIRSLRFVKLESGKPINAKRIVRLNHRVVVELANGDLYSNGVSGRAHCIGFSDADTMRLLMALGRITKQDYEAHRDGEKARELAQDVRRKAEAFLRLSENFLVVPTRKMAAKYGVTKAQYDAWVARI